MKEQLEVFYPNLSKDKIKRIYNPFDFEEIYKKAKIILMILIFFSELKYI